MINLSVRTGGNGDSKNNNKKPHTAANQFREFGALQMLVTLTLNIPGYTASDQQ